MRACIFVATLLSAVVIGSSAFALTDAELKKQFEGNISLLIQWAGKYDQNRHERCTMQVQKNINNVAACSKAFEVLIARMNTEAEYNRLRITSLSLDPQSRGQLLDSILTDTVVDNFNKETKRIADWIFYIYPAPK